MSKKILLSFITLFCCVAFLNAQISKGSVLLGGSIGVSSNTSESGNNKSTQKSFYVSPAIGVAVKTNLIAGGDLSYSYYKNSQPVFNETKYITYGAGVFVRKYFPVSGKFYLFGQARTGINIINSKSEDINGSAQKDKGWGINLGIVPGISYAVNKKLHIESGFNNIFFADYQHLNQQDISQGNSIKTIKNSFSLGSNLNNFSSSLFIGFRLLLNR